MPEGKSMLDPVKPEDSYSAKTHLHQAVSNPPEVATVAATALPANAPEGTLPSEVRPEIITWEKLVERFTDIIDVEFTANMESRLDDVETGKQNWKDLLADFYKDFSKELSDAETALVSMASVWIPILMPTAMRWHTGCRFGRS